MNTPIESKLVLTRRHWRVLALALLFAIAPAAEAQDADRDPPTRAARVVDVVGDAWLFDHENREWMRLSRNQTVGEGDRVRTDDRGRVSLRVGSTTIWVDERSDLELSQLDEGQTLLDIDRGDVAVRLRSVENAMETRLRTREGTVQPEREGLYRVEQLDSGSKVYVWQGRLRFDWARGAEPVWVGTGEQIEFWWPDGPRAERGPLYSDAFGDWVLAENREEGDRPVARYVSPEMTGAEDLDRYGRWESSPDYGSVWIPTAIVVADWAPYRYGHWAWSRHWGWTWVDDAPWGFAPFHYGRWVSWGGRWCWAPGPYVHRPVYAPALVGWVGGPSVSVGISIGSRAAPPSYGWYPLAPREVYMPGYHHSPRYVNRINDPRDLRDPVTVQRPNRYRDVPAAVSMLPAPGAAIQPMPVRGPDRNAEPGWARPLPSAPGRGELAAVLPAAPTRPAEVERPRDRGGRDVGAGWRGEAQLPRRDARPAVPAPQPAMPAVAQPQQPIPQPHQAIEQPQRGDNQPWRAQQQREEQQRRDEAQQLQQRREEQMRRDEMQRRVPQAEPQRMPEPPRAQPMPQPQPQPQPQFVPQQRIQPRDDGPQRGRPDGRREDKREDRRGSEPPKQNER
ncbi:DUF6600 domain-containing protein [Roseateles saccharophilus]|uniref:FecR family protein n=1 Tax=Roseateles saccharophilus TaxID=304 RepID=A0A4R3V5K5_ROSSA|nr:DUF6600 domain-containing protein [Roseateles saccharophilus]MDG0831508.1 hypothetical protein [Roseateles saccharophilus]TCU98608.1 FecR family protein [Roseateles saccharophilus]